MRRAVGKRGQRSANVSQGLSRGPAPRRGRADAAKVGLLAKVRRVSDWLLVLLYAGAVSVLSQMRQPPHPEALQISVGTLTLHAVEFGGFAFLLFRLLAHRRPQWSVGRLFLTTVAVTAGFAVADEVHQYFVPGRHCEAIDWLADVVGGAAVAAIWAFGRYKRGAGR